MLATLVKTLYIYYVCVVYHYFCIPLITVVRIHLHLQRL